MTANRPHYNASQTLLSTENPCHCPSAARESAWEPPCDPNCPLDGAWYYSTRNEELAMTGHLEFGVAVTRAIWGARARPNPP